MFEVTLGVAAATPGVACVPWEWTDSITAASVSVTSSVSKCIREMGTCVSSPLIHVILSWFTVAVLRYGKGCLCSCGEDKNGSQSMAAICLVYDWEIRV